METISSKENKTLKYISKLISSAKYRHSESRFVVEGVRLCEEALKNEAIIDTFICSKSASEKHSSIVKELEHKAHKSYICADHIFCALSDTKTPQGVLCVVKTLDKQSHFDTIKNNGLLLALDNIQDPSNLGTILRTADALGISGVVLSADCCDIYSPKVVRGSMGAVFRIPFLITDKLDDFITEFGNYGSSFACVLDSTAVSLSDVDFTAPALAVIGNEGNGVSSDVISACQGKLYIPMHNNAESLNAAVAASIVMWEMKK